MKPYLQTKLGTLYKGDFLKIVKEIPDQSIDCVCSDPPYGIDFLSNRTDHQEKIENDGFEIWQQEFPKWLAEFKRIITPTGVCVLCLGGGGGKYPVTAIGTLELKKYFKLIRTVVWKKNVFGLGWHYRPIYENILVGSLSEKDYNFYDKSKALPDLIEFSKVVPQKGDHPTQKPIELMRFFLKVHSKEGQTVIDPFIGSGCTAVACEEMNRKWIGIEINSTYVELAKKRIELKANQGKLFL